jgi:hypothetical protein
VEDKTHRLRITSILCNFVLCTEYSGETLHQGLIISCFGRVAQSILESLRTLKDLGRHVNLEKLMGKDIQDNFCMVVPIPV